MSGHMHTQSQLWKLLWKNNKAGTIWLVGILCLLIVGQGVPSHICSYDSYSSSRNPAISVYWGEKQTQKMSSQITWYGVATTNPINALWPSGRLKIVSPCDVLKCSFSKQWLGYKQYLHGRDDGIRKGHHWGLWEKALWRLRCEGRSVYSCLPELMCVIVQIISFHRKKSI